MMNTEWKVGWLIRDRVWKKEIIFLYKEQTEKRGLCSI